MKAWMNDFVARCLESIPDRGYRRRLTAELADHLEQLAADLAENGHAPEETRAAALERMGDPEELAARYLEEWRHRMNTPRYAVPRRVFLLSLVLYGAVMVGIGWNKANDIHVDLARLMSGFYLIPGAFFCLSLACALLKYDSWPILRVICWYFVALHGVYMIFFGIGTINFLPRFVDIPSLIRFVMHLVLAVWSYANTGWFNSCRALCVPAVDP